MTVMILYDIKELIHNAPRKQHYVSLQQTFYGN